MEHENTVSQLDSEEFLAFEVGGQGYAVAIATVREIRGWTEPSSMPDAPDYVMGVINLRGEVLPLMNLAEKLGLKTPDIDARSVIIVVEHGDQTVGLLVDSVSNIIAPVPDEIKPPPESASAGKNNYVAALTLLDDKITRILDLPSVLTANLKQLQEAS